MCNPIESINVYPVYTWAEGADTIRDFPEREFVIVEVVAGGLNERSTTEFTSRDEALAYANRIGNYYGVEVTEEIPA